VPNRPIARVWIVAAAAFGCLAVLAGSSPSADGARASRGVKIAADSDPGVTARRLARAIVSAKTPLQRHSAVLTMLRALNIGVYSASGRRAFAGSEDTPDDFYLYDFEVSLLAKTFASRRVTARQVASGLEAIVIRRHRSRDADERLGTLHCEMSSMLVMARA
jgi:hypothetical protein